jgi:hypothetical protein
LRGPFSLAIVHRLEGWQKSQRRKGGVLSHEELAAWVSSLTRTECAPVPAPDGARLICPQPWRGDRAYLHILHAPLDQDGIAELERDYQRKLPPQLRAFYEAMNGVQLFEASLNIDGSVGDLLDRSSGLHKPLCPRVAVSCFPSLHPHWHRLGYFPIGSLVGYSRKAIIASGREGDIVVIEEDSGTTLRKYASLFSALRMLGAELEPSWTPQGAMIGPEQHLDHIFLTAGMA